MSPKRKRNDSLHKKNVIKQSITKGLPYTNYKGKHVEGKRTGDDCRLVQYKLYDITVLFPIMS